MWRARLVYHKNISRPLKLLMHFSLLALAQGAQMYKLSRPRMTTENIIRIRGGRSVMTSLQRRLFP